MADETEDVELPSGLIIEGVPKGLSKEAIKRKAIAKGWATEDDFLPQPEQAEPTLSQKVDEYIPDVLSELAAASNKSMGEMIDFFGVDPINSILSLSGSEMRIPSAAEAVDATYMQPGLGRDMTRAAGSIIPEVMTLNPFLKATAKALPQAASGGKKVAADVFRQMADSPVTTDVAMGMAAGAGAEFGEEIGGETGKVAGSIAAPLAWGASANLIKGAFSKGKAYVTNMMRDVSDLSDEGAAKLLAEQMTREGLSPDDVQRMLDELGPDAIPADLGNNFARLLRAASNEVPRVESVAKEVLDERHAGQFGRILNAVDDSTGTSSLSVDDEIIRLEKATKPIITDLYEQARTSDFKISEPLKRLFSGKNSLARARVKANQKLIDKEALGETITDLDIVDATKRELDDQIGAAIRKGENAKAADLVRLKNRMIDEVDNASPIYKEARDAFAGVKELENAADLGGNYLKLKPREMREITKSMGESEKKMFKLGAKQAIIDRLDNMQVTADSVKRLFGKNGDVQKLRYLFDDEAAFKRFSDTLEKEALFSMTRRAAQANSTTVKQAMDIKDARQALDRAASLLANPAQAAGELSLITKGLSGDKSSKVYTEALEKAGDLLLVSGKIDQKRLIKMLERGNREEIERVLKRVIPKSKVVAPATKATLIQQGTDNATD